MNWEFRASVVDDAGWMAELRAEVMRADLERLGRFDPARVRARFLGAFVPAHTRVIVLDGADVGLIALRPERDEQWLEHFFLRRELQGRGIGGEVLARVLAGRDEALPVRLNVLRGSAARRLYERHGFVLDREDPIDVFLTLPARPPA